jgi:hypothetical protein
MFLRLGKRRFAKHMPLQIELLPESGQGERQRLGVLVIHHSSQGIGVMFDRAVRIVPTQTGYCRVLRDNDENETQETASRPTAFRLRAGGS